MKPKQSFFVYRNTDKILVRTFMNNLDWDPNNEAKDLTKADSFSEQQLRAMQFVARMKEAADRCGAGFVGGFISPTGDRFMMSNMEDGDVQKEEIERQLNQLQQERMQMMNIHEQIQKMMDDFEG